MLVGVVVFDCYVFGVVWIYEGVWYDLDKGGESGVLCKYGNFNVLIIDIGIL